MWSLIDRKTQLTIIVALTVVILLGLQALTELLTGAEASGFRLLSAIVFLIGTVLVGLFNLAWRWVWRKAPVMNKWFFPDLNGTWEGTLKSTWINPETGQSPGPIAAVITIKQSLFDICVRQKTGESNSYSNREIAEAEPKADRYRLWYSYSNRPKAELAYRSLSHDGVAWLEVNLSDDPNCLEGQYYTSRKTTGDMLFRRQG
ncbi:hypothetical protein [Sphingobium sp. YC-XJ3]|uniref:Cap15 family cyclic dinucleotide receptor domain-containing protein n=1 Tax=Sphingobium sp. YC-XJ3 TaxID=3024245 RepID=UPI002361C074|nr:hypothetical protein [Sphingobium sp. YC-XJ3]WDA38953.1 hypothetical protein PO876_12630 [Sphingobium sp. YC-XJ3]